MKDIGHLDEATIHALLATAHEATLFREDIYPFLKAPPRPAAVLIPIIQLPESTTSIPAWHVLLTKRSSQLSEHRGQVAFPGGRSDPNDLSPEKTALREAHEEIGLNPSSVSVIGRLGKLITISNYCITPIVGIVNSPFDYKPTSNEVDRVFSIPLSWLADTNNFEIRERVIPEQYTSLFGNQSFPVVYFRPYEGETLWGVSAEITLQLINALTST